MSLFQQLADSMRELKEMFLLQQELINKMVSSYDSYYSHISVKH